MYDGMERYLRHSDALFCNGACDLTLRFVQRSGRGLECSAIVVKRFDCTCPIQLQVSVVEGGGGGCTWIDGK